MGLKNNEISAKKYFKHYNYPEEVLNYIRALIPNDIKDQILEILDKVSRKEFCEPLQIKLL